MKKLYAFILAAVLLTLCSCTEVTRVDYNLGQQADNFNIEREITVFNTRTDFTAGKAFDRVVDRAHGRHDGPHEKDAGQKDEEQGDNIDQQKEQNDHQNHSQNHGPSQP